MQTSNGNQEVEGKEMRKVVRELSSWSFKVIYTVKNWNMESYNKYYFSLIMTFRICSSESNLSGTNISMAKKLLPNVQWVLQFYFLFLLLNLKKCKSNTFTIKIITFFHIKSKTKQNHPQEEIQKGKMVVWEGLTNS